MPTHTAEKDLIFYTVYYTRIWISSLNKDKGADSYRQFPGTKNVWNGAILSGCHHTQDNTQCPYFT